jgi:hypothetical protein
MLMAAQAQGNGQLAGTAKNEAKKPYDKFSVRARNVSQGQQQGSIAGTTQLDTDGKFNLPGLAPAKYVVELLNQDGKLICAEGPFDITINPNKKDDIKISCGHPAAWWLLAAAGAAGVTAGIVAAESSAAN